MRRKIVPIILVVTLVIATGFVNALSISLNDGKNNNTSLEGISTLGIGGWHNEASMEQNGDELTDIYKTGNGDWEYPYEGNCAHIWAAEQGGNIGTTTAEYTFNVKDGPVNYVKYEINYKDVGWWSDGPDAKIYTWDDSWDVKSNIGGVGSHHYDYSWEDHTFDQNSIKYVNDEGEIRVAVQAWDGSSWPHQDDISIKKMKLSYQTPDEEIFQASYNPYDDDNDGSDDSTDITIDADVGNFGDGTTVEVTATCELVDPNHLIVDSKSSSWIIIDHQVEQVTINVSALDGINGMYTIRTTLYDEYGNNESYTTETLYLEPDPQRSIMFFTEPYDTGAIIFDEITYLDSETTIVSDDTYEISAVPVDYYVFDHWSNTSGVSVVDPYSNNTQVVISGDGTLTAHYQFILNTVFFYIDPEDAGTIICSEYAFENGEGVYASDGVYEISAIPVESYYYFESWETTGGNITIQDYYAQSTLVAIYSDGNITANFVLNEPPVPPIRPDGPISGEIYVDHTYTSSTIDPNDGDLYYLFDWGDGTDSGWLGPYNSGSEVSATHQWAGARDYDITVTAKDEFGLESEPSEPLTVTMYSQPSTPIITGTVDGKPNTPYEYTFVSTDPDSDSLYFWIEWGDGTTEQDDWIGPYNSGEVVTLTHTWNSKEIFTIKAIAKDSSDIVSEWGTLTVSTPRNRLVLQPHFEFLQRLIDHFPILQYFFKLPLFEKIVLL